MRASLYFFILIFSASLLWANSVFDEGNYYFVKYDIKNKLKQTDSTDEEEYSITKGSKIYIEKADNVVVIFRVTKSAKPKNKDSTLVYVKKGSLYQIETNSIEDFYFRKLSGFSAGIATVPFKYRPNKEKFYPGGNLAAAGAWWYNLYGITIKPMAFAGITTISVADVNNQDQDTETKVGFTCGLGLSFNVVGEFDLGVTAGWDFVDKDWDSNKKDWYAFSFGYSFF